MHTLPMTGVLCIRTVELSKKFVPFFLRLCSDNASLNNTAFFIYIKCGFVSLAIFKRKQVGFWAVCFTAFKHPVEEITRTLFFLPPLVLLNSFQLLLRSFFSFFFSFRCTSVRTADAGITLPLLIKSISILSTAEFKVAGFGKAAGF